MSVKELSLADFSERSVDRIRYANRNFFGVWSLKAPRWFPIYPDTCFFPPLKDVEDQKAFTLNGTTPGFDWTILTKFAAFGLAAHSQVPHTSLGLVPGIVINEHGMEFLLNGRVDFSLPLSDVGRECWRHVQEPEDTVRARNSALVEGVHVSAVGVRIGAASTPSGFMAVVYDDAGRRVTDVFVESQEWPNLDALADQWRKYHRSPELRSAINAAEYELAYRLGALFGVAREAVGYDSAVAEDIAGLDASIFTGERCSWQDIGRWVGKGCFPLLTDPTIIHARDSL
jgi:hypothetical protein